MRVMHLSPDGEGNGATAPEAPAQGAQPAPKPAAPVAPPEPQPEPARRTKGESRDAGKLARLREQEADELREALESKNAQADTLLSKLAASEHRTSVSEVAADKGLTKSERSLLLKLVPVGADLAAMESEADALLSWRTEIQQSEQQKAQQQIETMKAEQAEAMKAKARFAPALPPEAPSKTVKQMTAHERAEYLAQGGGIAYHPD